MTNKLTKSDKLGIIEYYRQQSYNNILENYIFKLETLDDLMKRDEQREKDGFKKKIRLGKFVNPGRKGKSDSVVVVPTTTEEKLYHGPFNPQKEDETGGEGEGEEGDIIGEKPIDDDGNEGEEGDAGSGDGGDHGLSKEVYEAGKILTEQFDLPNIENKGKKIAIPQYTYDLTDINDKSGQLLDKKKTLHAICKTNIALNRLNKDKKNTKDFIVRPDDKIYRVLSKEKMYESQAIVFMCRDYSGSMMGAPTEVITKQHLMIYSWLAYQYNNRVTPRFILHDTKAKEVPDFATYYRSQIAGGTMIYSAYQLINEIIKEEGLESDYNIYILHGTDGDDWDDKSQEMIDELAKMIESANRVGITIAKNNWGDSYTTLEKHIGSKGLKAMKKKFRVDVFNAREADDERIINSIKYLMSEE